MLTKTKLESLLKNTADIALRRRVRMIIEELKLQDGDKILEVGSGDGYYLYILSSLGLKLDLTGADFDKKALGSAKRNLRGKGVKLVYADLMAGLPFGVSTFDKVIMSEVLEHLSNDVKGLGEVGRVLKKNGILVLTVPNANYPFLWDPTNWLLEKLFNTHIKSGFWAGIWNQHLRLYKPSQLRRVVLRAGLRIDKIMPLTFWSLAFNHYLVNLGARILASKKGPRVITQGANKFSKGAKKSVPLKLFFLVSNLVDPLNDLWMPRNSGVSIFLKATKK